jgi:peroxiredoxin
MSSLCLVGITALALLPTPTATAPIGAEVGDVALRDEHGVACRLADWDEGRPLVIALVATECPMAELYAGRLAELAEGFGPRGVAFVGLSSHPRDSAEAIGRFRAVHRIRFPVLEDRGGVIAERLGATRTPTVVVLDERRAIRYRGRIDDQYVRGARLAAPRHRDLAGAIEALLAGRPVDPSETEAIGCPIDRPEPGSGSLSGTVTETETYTYDRDVAPILRRRCVVCHSKGQIAPFSLATYRQASGWAQAMAEAVLERRMPPWHADPAYGTFANDAHLTETEIGVITGWVRQGCPKGAAIAPLVPLPERGGGGWSIPGPDLVVAIPRPFLVPAEGIVDYQEFEVDPGFGEDRWVAAAEIQPGSRAVVHHCTVFLKPAGAAGPEYTPGALGSFCLAAMAPGTPAMILPPGMAKRIPAGWRIVFVVHYAPNGTAQTDQTRLGLTVASAKAVRHEVVTQLLYDPDLRIPPYAANHRVERSWQAPADLLLLAMFPHMHLRGKSFRYEAAYPDGTSETLLYVPRYDFNWQHRYVLAEPKRIPAGTTLRCIAHYDNSAANPANPDPGATVRTGKQSSDEMFNGYFDVALAEQNHARFTQKIANINIITRVADRRSVPLASAFVILVVCGMALRWDGRGRHG